MSEREEAKEQGSEDHFYAALGDVEPELPAAIRAFLDRIAVVNVKPDWDISLRLIADHPTGGSPIPLGTIDREGRVSIDDLIGHLPVKYAYLYARELQHLVGFLPGERLGCRIVAEDSSKPPVSKLLAGRSPDSWEDAIATLIERARHYFEARAAGRYTDGFLLADDE